MNAQGSPLSHSGAAAGAAPGTTRRVLLCGSGAALTSGAAFLAACGAPVASTPNADSAVSAAPYKLVSGNKFAAGERLDWAQQTAAEFSRLYGPKLTAEHVIITGDALLAALAAGSGPDATQATGATFSDWAEKGLVQEITPYVKRDKVDMSRWYLQEETFARKGKQYGMPFWQAHAIYLYNKTLFTKYGVKPPDNDTWTWNDMLDAAVKLTKSGETFGINMDYGFEFSWINFLRSAGENFINQDKTHTTLNTPGAIEVFQWLVDLSTKHKVQPMLGDSTSLGAGDWWKLGKIGIQLAGTGTLGTTLTAKPDFEWDMFVTPKHPKTGKRAISSNENPMVVTSNSKNPEAAYKLVSFFADKFSEDLVGKYRINMPSLKASAADQAGWLSTPPPMMKLSLEQMKQARGLDFHLNWSNWYTQITNQMQAAFKGEAGVKEACDNATQLGDSLLKGV